MFQIEYFYRWNERIVAPTQGNGGVSGDGAISDIIDVNLAPNRLLISDPSGKIIVSSLVTAEEAQTLQGIDTGETIQEQLDGKQDALTLGNLTEATSSVLTITGGSAAIVGSGLTIQVKQAGAGQAGYLSSTDWNTFNNKLTGSLASAFVFVGNGSGVATGVAISGDIGITNAGVASISAGVIVNADINASAAIARSKTANGTAYRILANNASGVMSENAALTATRIIVADANGQLVASAATTTHATYISTLTSDAQVQLNEKIVGKATNALVRTPTASEDGFAITWSHGSQEWQLTDPVIQGIPVGGSTSQVLMKTSGADYAAAWTSIFLSHVSDVNSSAADVNVLQGADAAGVTTTIIGYLGTANPVNGPIQDQLDAKQSSSLAMNAMWVGNGSGIAAQLAPGTSGYVLTSVGGVPVWQPPTNLADGDRGDVVVSGSGAVWTVDTNINKIWTGSHEFTTTQLVASLESAATNTVLYPFKVRRTSSGTPANGIGVGIHFETETTASNNEVGGIIESVAADITAASEDFDLIFKTMSSGSAASERLRIRYDGAVIVGSNLSLGPAGISTSSGDLSINSASGLINFASYILNSSAGIWTAPANSAFSWISGDGVDGSASDKDGKGFEFTTGDADTTSGNGSGGHVVITTGAKRGGGSGVDGNIALLSGLPASWQAMGKGIFIANATTVPTGNPTGGGFLYVEAGALKYRGTGGTVTTIGPA